VFFCDPRSQGPRPERNTDGLPRQYAPKGTYLSMHSARDPQSIAIKSTTNDRPRRVLGWQTPTEVLITNFAMIVETTGRNPPRR
jgi:IS30 family transposase